VDIKTKETRYIGYAKIGNLKKKNRDQKVPKRVVYCKSITFKISILTAAI